MKVLFKRNAGMAFAIALVCLAAACGWSKSNKSQAATEAKKQTPVVNSICPVMGGTVAQNTPYYADYKGKRIGFCCEECVAAFNKDPEKYMAKIKKETAAGKKSKKCVVTCPGCNVEFDYSDQCEKAAKEGVWQKTPKAPLGEPSPADQKK